jgi:hypothetical protein
MIAEQGVILNFVNIARLIKNVWLIYSFDNVKLLRSAAEGKGGGEGGRGGGCELNGQVFR